MKRGDAVTQISMEEQRIKALFKAAMAELFEERPELLRDALEDALEELGLVDAIVEGEQTTTVSREAIMSELDAVR
jgi:hypothetical protein